MVYPSVFGPDNLPPLEAICFGCPAIVAKISGSKDQLGDQVRWFEPMNDEGLATLILDAICSKRDESRLEYTGWTSCEKNVEKLLELFTHFREYRQWWGVVAAQDFENRKNWNFDAAVVTRRNERRIELLEKRLNNLGVFDAETRLNQAQKRANQAETRANQAEGRAKQAEARAKQAEAQVEAQARRDEARVQQAKARAQQAEGRAKHAWSRAENFQHRYAGIKNSRSWKWTAALRRVESGLVRLRDGPRGAWHWSRP